MKKWIKIAADISQESAPAESTSAYSRNQSDDFEKQEQLTNQLREMTRAHNSSSASNRAIRNSFYGTKD